MDIVMAILVALGLVSPEPKWVGVLAPQFTGMTVSAPSECYGLSVPAIDDTVTIAPTAGRGFYVSEIASAASGSTITQIRGLVCKLP